MLRVVLNVCVKLRGNEGIQRKKEDSTANSQEGETVRMKGDVQLSQKMGLRNCGKAWAKARRRRETASSASGPHCSKFSKIWWLGFIVNAVNSWQL